jgi:hypothetical protein
VTLYRVTITTPERLTPTHINVAERSPGQAIHRTLRAAAWLTPGWRPEVDINESARLGTASADFGAVSMVARPMEEDDHATA